MIPTPRSVPVAAPLPGTGPESLSGPPDGSVRRVFSRPGASLLPASIPESDVKDLLPGPRKPRADPPPPQVQTVSEARALHARA